MGGLLVTGMKEFASSVMGEQMAEPFDLLLGRKTYEIFAAYWPYAKSDDIIGGKFNAAKKYVVSTTLKKLDWNNSTLIKDNVVERN